MMIIINEDPSPKQKLQTQLNATDIEHSWI